MGNGLGGIVSSIKKTVDHIDSKVNFSIPENSVSYSGIHGKQNDKYLGLNEENFRLQIGKMTKEGETIYTKEILLSALQYIFKKTKYNEKAVIQLRPDLAKYLTNENQKDAANEILSFEDEKAKIIRLVKRFFKEKLKNIDIINVSQTYPEIFALLKSHGKDGLASNEKPSLNEANFSALQLAKYLYRMSQNNQKLMRLFYDTKTSAQKENDTKAIGQNQSDYYSLVEVAIRLYEVVSGISIQGGIDRQNKYDQIIGGILEWKDMGSFKTKDYPELKELYEVCDAINDDIVFNRLSINTKDVREITEKKKTRSKFKLMSAGISVALISALAGGGIGYQLYGKMQKDEIKHKKEQHRKDHLNSRGIGIQAAPYYHELYEISNQLSDRFIKYYGIGNLSKDQIIDGISLYLEKFESGTDRYNKLNKQDIYNADAFLAEFVDEYFCNIMFENGFTTLERKTITEALIEESINTLKYTGPSKEGYNETSNTYTRIHSAIAIDNDGISSLKNSDLVSGIIVNHKGHVSTITVTGTQYQDAVASSQDVILLDQKGPDENNSFTIKRFIFDKNGEDQIQELKATGQKVIFLNNHQHNKARIHEHENLVISKDKIIDLFEKEDLVFQHCRKSFMNSEAIDHNKLNTQILIELKRLMIIDIYTKNDYSNHPFSDINVTISAATPYVSFFLEEYVKTHKNVVEKITYPNAKFSKFVAAY